LQKKGGWWSETERKVSETGRLAKWAASLREGHTNFRAGQILLKNSKTSGAECSAQPAHTKQLHLMKQIYFLLLLPLALTLACNKTFEYEYAVVCEFLPSIGKKNLLLITADDGSLLKEIEIPQGASNLNEKFELSLKQPDESLNLHIVQEDDNGYLSVRSHFGVRNAQAVDLRDRSDFLVFNPPAQKEIKVAVTGLNQPFTEVEFMGCSYYKIQGSPNPVFSVSLSNGQSLAIRIAHSDWLFVPEDKLSDSIVVDQKQFLPAYSLKQLVLVPPSNSGSFVTAKVYLVSPDAQSYAFLDWYDSVISSEQKFPLPYGIPLDWDYHVSFSNRTYFLQKTFPPSDTIYFKKPSIDVALKQSVLGGNISIKCTGPVDWLEVLSGANTNNGQSFFWKAMGSPNDFENLQMPSALKDHLPEYARLFKAYTVRAFHAPDYGSQDMMRGFPWKSTEPFVASRKGYEMVQK
jgi:hypothetical protein